MNINCPYCNQEYKDLPDDYINQKANCGACGKDFIIKKTQPDTNSQIIEIIPAKPIKYESSLNYGSFDEACSKAVAVHAHAEQQHEQYLELHESYTNDPLDIAYSKFKLVCATESPVPEVFKDFFKLCRKKNKLDISSKNYKSVIRRVQFMQKLDKKLINVIWYNMNATRKVTHTTKLKISEHYTQIKVTDIKNLEKCKSLLKK